MAERTGFLQVRLSFKNEKPYLGEIFGFPPSLLVFPAL